MSLGDWLRNLLSPAAARPADVRRLPSQSECELASTLQSLLPGERGWIALGDAARIFSDKEPESPSARWMRRAMASSPGSRPSASAVSGSCPWKAEFISVGKIEAHSTESLCIPGRALQENSLPMGRDCRYELFSGTGPAAFAEDFSVAPWSRQSVWRRGSPQRAPKLVVININVARVQEATAISTRRP